MPRSRNTAGRRRPTAARARTTIRSIWASNARRSLPAAGRPGAADARPSALCLWRASARSPEMAAPARGRRGEDGRPPETWPARARLDLFRRSVRQSPGDHLSWLQRCRRDAPADGFADLACARMSAAKSSKECPAAAGLLLALVDRVSHRGGDPLALMTEAGTPLPQILFLTRLRQAGGRTASELGVLLNMSPPAVSQMVDRLFRLGLLSRVEDVDDRRRKRLATPAKADHLLHPLTPAPGAPYRRGVSRLSTALRKELAAILAKAVKELS